MDVSLLLRIRHVNDTMLTPRSTPRAGYNSAKATPAMSVGGLKTGATSAYGSQVNEQDPSFDFLCISGAFFSFSSSLACRCGCGCFSASIPQCDLNQVHATCQNCTALFRLHVAQSIFFLIFPITAYDISLSHPKAAFHLSLHSRGLLYFVCITRGISLLSKHTEQEGRNVRV